MVKKNLPNAVLVYAESEFDLSLEKSLDIAESFLCLSSEDSSCKECISCRMFLKKNHPDVFFLFPCVSNKEESYNIKFLELWRKFLTESGQKSYFDWISFSDMNSKNPQILKGSLNQLMEWLAIPPIISKYKIVHIAFAEHMNHFTYNALLKSIEEPNKNVSYILCTHNKSAIPETILSRCQQQLAPISEYTKTIKFVNNTSEDLNVVFEKQDSFSLFKIWMRACYKKDFLVLYEIAELFYKQGFAKQKMILVDFLQILNCVLKYYSEVKLNDEYIANEEFIKFIQKYSQTISSDEVLDYLIEYIDKTCIHLANNANAKLSFTNLSIIACDLFK